MCYMLLQINSNKKGTIRNKILFNLFRRDLMPIPKFYKIETNYLSFKNEEKYKNVLLILIGYDQL